MKLHTFKNSFALPLAPRPLHKACRGKPLSLVFIPYPHYLAFLCPCTYFKARRQGIFLNQKGMIPCCLKWVFNSFENGLAVVIDGRGLPVHKPRSPHNLCTKSIADGLMAKTNTEDRNFSCKFLYNINRYASLLRVAWPRRYYNLIGLETLYLLYRNFIITIHPHILTQFTKRLNEVVGKGVVVVNHE